MAKITKLTLDGYKGQSAVEQLSGLDIFVGPNGAGKSSRPEGLSLALLGYVPGGPKQVGEIMLVSNYVRNFHRVSKWFKPPGGSPEFVQG